MTARPLLALSWLACGCGAPHPPSAAPVPAGERVYRSDPARVLPAARGGPCMDAVLADLDGDGALDVVLAHEGPGNVVLVGDGSGRFTQAATPAFAPQGDSEQVAVADLDADGALDLYVANEDLGGVDDLYLGDGQGGWRAAHDRIPWNATSNAVWAGDLDEDGVTDVLVGNAGRQDWWRATADGLEDRSDRLPDDPDITQDLAVGDVDGDGRLDVVLGQEGANVVWRQTADGWAVDTLPGGAAWETREVDLGDVDGDGDLDLVAANVGWRGTDPQDRLLLRDGAGWIEAALPAEAWNSLDLDTVDLDGDGDLDLLGAAQGPVYAWRNDGAGGFVDATAALLPEQPSGEWLDVEVGDLDGDGLDDLYLCNRGGEDQVLFGGVVRAAR